MVSNNSLHALFFESKLMGEKVVYSQEDHLRGEIVHLRLVFTSNGVVIRIPIPLMMLLLMIH